MVVLVQLLSAIIDVRWHPDDRVRVLERCAQPVVIPKLVCADNFGQQIS